MGAGASLEASKVMPQVRQEYDKLVKGEITEEQACRELKNMIGAAKDGSAQKAQLALNVPEGAATPETPARARRHTRAHSWQRLTQEADTGDKWETTKQPVCYLCKMVFPNQLKLDRHIQYSVVHKKNMEPQSTETNGSEQAKAPPAAPLPSVLDVEVKTGQLLYSGSKFFWRSSESYDIYIYLHPHHNCLEVIACDCDVELRRLYLDNQKVAARSRSEPLSTAPETPGTPGTPTWDSDSRPSTPIPEAAQEAEQLRRQLTHYIMARLQLKEFPDMKGMCLVGLSGDGDNSVDDLILAEPPAGLPHTSVRKRRRTSISDFNKLLDNFQENAKELESNTTKATSLVNASMDTVQKFTKNRRRYLHQSMSTLPDAKKRWDEASVKGTLVLDVDKTKRLLQEMADAVHQAETVIRSPDPRDPST